jgi:regulator of sirC expression with transglutaminase-like and TPR domain
MQRDAFCALASTTDPPLEELALALAAEFEPVDERAVRGQLDVLADDARPAVAEAAGDPAAELEALSTVLGRRHGFLGDTEAYDDPLNSMLPAVLERRRGLPITLSVLWVAVARRAGVPLVGVGLPGHYVAGRFDDPAGPRLVDPFAGGVRIDVGELPSHLVRPWGPQETAMRMLNNLVGAYTRRGALGQAIVAAELRLVLPAVDGADPDRLAIEARALRAQLN